MRSAAVLANLLILLMFLLAAGIYFHDESLYYLAVQEDEYLEWATFWAFILASAMYILGAIRESRAGGWWFLIGLSLFCFVVAMEEISWAQRLLGYRAPDFFLESNYQQELNIHNVVETGARKLIMQAILLGYGVIMSGLSLWAPFSNVFRRLRIVTPPPALIVGFLAMFVVYSWYPWSHTGEWVELTMGFGFAFAALFFRHSIERDGAFARESFFKRSLLNGSLLKSVAMIFVAVWALSALTVFAVRLVYAADPGKVDQARLEVEALASDFASGRLHTRCGVHKRLYTFLIEYQQPYLLEGEYASLLRVHDEDDRARYLLDPWNSAYWIRHKCDDGRVVRFVYSFGPNRRRDSSEWEILGEDIGAYLGTNP
jgi:hypothetical protein